MTDNYELLWMEYNSERSDNFFINESSYMLDKLEKYSNDEQKKSILLEKYIVSVIRYMYLAYMKLEHDKDEWEYIDKIIKKFIIENKDHISYYKSRKNNTKNFLLKIIYHIGCYLLTHTHKDIIKIMNEMFKESEKLLLDNEHHESQCMLFFLYNFNKKYNLNQNGKICDFILRFSNISRKRFRYLMDLCKLASKIDDMKQNDLAKLIDSLVKESENETDPYMYRDAMHIAISAIKENVHTREYVLSLKEKFAKRMEKFGFSDIEPLLRIEFLSNANEIYAQTKTKLNNSKIDKKISLINSEISNTSKKIKWSKIEHEISIEPVHISGNTGIERVRFIIDVFNQFIPSVDKIYSLTKNLTNQYPLTSLFSRITIEQNSLRSISINDEDIQESKFIDTYQFRVDINEQILSRSIKELEKSEKITSSNYYDYIEISGMHDKKNEFDIMALKIIEKGIMHHCNCEYVESVHLLIPQIEDILKRILGKNNLPISRIDKNSYPLDQTLGRLISNATPIFREDVIKYLQMKLLRYGKNQRNKICHGLSTPDLFNHSTSLSIICIILFLTYWYNYRK